MSTQRIRLHFTIRHVLLPWLSPLPGPLIGPLNGIMKWGVKAIGEIRQGKRLGCVQEKEQGALLGNAEHKQVMSKRLVSNPLLGHGN